MSGLECALLLDGAVLGGHELLREAQLSGGVALYDDLGDSAREVGPWLWPGATLASARLLPMPLRHGASELQSSGSLDELVAHLGRVRYIHTHDGQRYFLRYADMRAVAALHSAFDAAQWAFFTGPVSRWRHVDRHEVEQAVVAQAAPASGAVEELRLSAAQLATLLDAGLPDRLCLAVEELEEQGLTPASDARQFDRLAAAAPWLRQRGIESHVLQRAIARQAVLHGPEVLDSAEFQAVLQEALDQDEATAVDAWIPGLRKGGRR